MDKFKVGDVILYIKRDSCRLMITVAVTDKFYYKIINNHYSYDIGTTSSFIKRSITYINSKKLASQTAELLSLLYI